ncbi:MAG: hypothetical protein AB1758_07905 [Candidatus Eremiobacterota bacterium]
MSETKKGAYDNVFMQEMLQEVEKQEGHQQKSRKELGKIGKTQKTSNALLRIVVILVLMAALGGLGWLATVEPQYTPILGGFGALFVIFGASILFFKRT